MLLAACGVLLVLIALSVRANRQFAAYNQLPMQFGPGGVGWRAPRVTALSVMPALAAVILIPTALFSPTWHGVLIAGPCLILGHLLHLWLIQQHLQP